MTPRFRLLSQDVCDKFQTCALVLASRDGRTGAVRLIAEAGAPRFVPARARAPCTVCSVHREHATRALWRLSARGGERCVGGYADFNRPMCRGGHLS